MQVDQAGSAHIYKDLDLCDDFSLLDLGQPVGPVLTKSETEVTWDFFAKSGWDALRPVLDIDFVKEGHKWQRHVAEAKL